MENVDYHCGIDANDLSLVLDLVLPLKFKTPYCPEAHITMFCRRITGYINNDKLLVGSASKWYNQLSRIKINSWKDLAQAFMKQYGHVTDMTPDRITLQNMEKKQNESFRQYAQRWREVATQVQPPLFKSPIHQSHVGKRY
ncbi:Gag-pro-like protein [Gossypium australe]|uniref:Gag-pro-like protein n=1 Tax=Gossypium australe TaxID=47621 RepID=A0A5B6X247_9ROSI|nr:Gag-pro-like protein [Gossypium australe]